jgi:hypothetical protein
MSGESLPVFLEPPWFFLTFVALWFGMTGLLAHWSGWASLGRQYAATEPVSGKRYFFSSGSMGRKFLSVNYGNCLFVTTNSKGLHIAILFPFRFLCPPLFIPWSGFESVQRRSFLFFPYYVLTIRGHLARIVLYAWTGRSAKEAYDSARAVVAL